MIIVVAFLVALVLGWVSGSIWLTIHGRILEKNTSTCSECGGRTIVKPDPQNSRLLVSCQNKECFCVTSHPVRPSALSLFGITQLLLAFITGTLIYLVVDAMKYSLPLKVFAAIMGILLGLVVIRFFIRAIVFALIQVRLPVAWQEEMVAYLAPPPFLKREGQKLKNDHIIS